MNRKPGLTAGLAGLGSRKGPHVGPASLKQERVGGERDHPPPSGGVSRPPHTATAPREAPQPVPPPWQHISDAAKPVLERLDVKREQ